MRRRDFILLLGAAEATQMSENPLLGGSQSSLFPSGAVFTVGREWVPVEKVSPENDPTFDLAVVEFNDDGSLADAGQKRAVADCITAARRSNRNGALVVVSNGANVAGSGTFWPGWAGWSARCRRVFVRGRGTQPLLACCARHGLLISVF